MDRIEKLVEEEGPFLLISPEGWAKLVKDQPLFSSECLVGMDLLGAVEKFRRLAGGQVEFTATDLVKISGQHYAAVQRWCDSKLIGPTRTEGRERIFDFHTAFAVGVFGSLIRQRQDATVLRAVANVLGVSVSRETKATVRA